MQRNAEIGLFAEPSKLVPPIKESVMVMRVLQKRKTVFEKWTAGVCPVLPVLLLLSLLPATALAERLSVAVPIANVRSGPGGDHQLLWKVEKYHPLEIVKKSGSWYQFKDFEGDRGWISAPLLAKVPAVITKADNCNIRSGPGTQYDVVFVVDRGIPFKVLDKKDKWLQIQHADGDKGWIHDNLVW
ncbi:MAG: SH3 domain-containing protein [Desulfobacteraceae bacterium]|nr:SH3 domain-containing protein [Desulfobacteraceae bacterium]